MAFLLTGVTAVRPETGVNALLSFVYSILGKDISGALQGVGLDPQVGFLHRRPAGARQFGAGYFGRISCVVGRQVGVVAD